MQWMYVEPYMVAKVWEKIAPSIRRGLRVSCGDTLTEEVLVQRLEEGKTQLWVRVEDDGRLTASIILKLERRPKGLAIAVLMLGGKWWNDGLAMKALREYAAKIGAYTIEGIARNALVDKLKACGWRQKAVVMEFGGIDEREERRSTSHLNNERPNNQPHDDADATRVCRELREERSEPWQAGREAVGDRCD